MPLAAKGRIDLQYGVFNLGDEFDETVIQDSEGFVHLKRGIMGVREGVVALRSLTQHSMPRVHIRVWDTEDQMPPTEPGHETWVRDMAFGTTGTPVPTTVSVWGLFSEPYFQLPVPPGFYRLRAQAGNLDAARQEELAGEIETSEIWIIDIAPISADEADVSVTEDASEEDTVTLWRPTGPEELALVEDSGWRAWPPRLPDQPIFYPVLNEDYARKIACEWNVPASGVGHVTRFEVTRSFLDRYDVQQAGGQTILEYWIPADDLAELNDNIVGLIELVATYR